MKTFPKKLLLKSDTSHLENQQNKLHIYYITEKPWMTSVRTNKAHLRNMFIKRRAKNSLLGQKKTKMNCSVSGGNSKHQKQKKKNQHYAHDFLQMLSDPDLCPD